MLRLQGQIRFGGIGTVTGIDLVAALQLAENLNYDKRAISHLLPMAEAGLITALNKDRTEQNDE
ncbi:hypothetical protein LF95_04040 [Thalassospira sp. TSL5-1]|nr:hypothetical protein LF95_04040 [Thalassospira sp. TSL5-1]